MVKKRRGCGCLFIIIMLLLLVACCDTIYTQIAGLFFPLDYYDYIEQEADKYGIDPYLISAFIRAESGFDEAAYSAAGACGLMQLMPETAEWINGQAGFGYDVEQAIWQPEANIRMGIWYIDWLTDTYYGGNLTLAIAAYNAGLSNVNGWLEEGVWLGDAEDLSGIPYAETRSFVAYVYEGYAWYLRLYG